VLKRLGRHSAREVAARIDGEIARRRRRAEALEKGAVTEPAAANPDRLSRDG